MTDDYRAIAIFVAVADQGGFTQAGKHLNLSTSVVSHHISRLEKSIGTALFFRSTRSISLTPDGARMIDAARRMVTARNEAIDAISDADLNSLGALNISMPAFGDTTNLHQRIWAFARRHDRLEIKLHHTDAMVDIIKEGFDVAIRLGRLSDSSLKRKRIGDFHRILVASPGYLRAVAEIKTPDDLQKCEMISFAMLPDGFVLEKGARSVNVAAKSTRIQINSISSVKSAIKAGLGIQRLPASEVQEDLEAGTLVRVLPDWDLPAEGVYAVWPDLQPLRNLTRSFIDFITEPAN